MHGMSAILPGAMGMGMALAPGAGAALPSFGIGMAPPGWPFIIPFIIGQDAFGWGGCGAVADWPSC